MLFVAAFPPHVHVEAWGVAMATAALMGALALPPSRLGAAKGWLACLVVALLAINIATSIQVMQAARTGALLTAYGFVFLHCAGLSRRRQPDETKAPIVESGGDPAAPLLLGLILVGSALALHGLYQLLYSFPRLADAVGSSGVDAGQEFDKALRIRLAARRAVGTLGLPAALGGLLGLTLPITAGWFATRKGMVRRATLLGLMALQMTGLLATRSVGAIGSLCLAVAAILWASTRAKDVTPARLRRASAIVLIVAGAAGSAILVAARLSGSTPATEGAGPLLLRAGNWQVAGRILIDHLVLGVGAGCYGISFPFYRTWEMNESRFAHNSYLQAVAEGGVALGALVILAAGVLAWQLVRHARGSDPMAPFLAAACLAFLIHNLADFTVYLPTVGIAFFSLAGLAVGNARAVARGSVLWRAVMGAGALCLALFSLTVTRADVKLGAARDLVVSGERLSALAPSEAAVRLDPFDPEARSFLSHLLMDLARSDPSLPLASSPLLSGAEAEARRAIELDPRTPHHWHHLGQVLLARGDPQGAYLALARAVTLYPIQIEYRKDRDAVGAALSGGAR